MGWSSAIYAAHFTHAARVLGAEVTQPSVLARLGREPIVTDRMDLAELLNLIEDLLRVTGRRDLGIVAAREIRDHDSPTFHLVAALETAEAGLDALIRYSPLLGDSFRYHTRLVGDDLADVCLQRTEVAPHRVGMDLILEFELAAFAIGSDLLFPPARIPRWREAWFSAPDAPVEAFGAAVGCSARAGMPSTLARFDRCLLGSRPLRANATLAGFLRRQLDGFVDRLPAPTPATSERVRGYLQGALASDPTASGCAHALGMSERTLSRRLVAEGTRFQYELDRVRYQLACAWLPGVPLIEIADRLGYSDESAFRRAFRRWSGSSPSVVRRALAKGGAEVASRALRPRETLR